MRGRSTAGAMPDIVEPMQTGSGELPAGEDWAVEFAWSGLRVIAYVHPKRTKLLTVTGRLVTSTFADLDGPLARAAPRRGAILDGTVVALGETGFPRRRLLQSRSGTQRPSEALMRRVPVGFLASDVLWLNGHSTVELPYHRRRELLGKLELDQERVWSSPSFPAAHLGPVMVAAEQHGADALYAKHLDAPYRPGRRSRYWLRVPVRPVRQVLVGGWSPADPRRPDSIGALLLGVPDDATEPPGLRYVGRAGLRSVSDRRDVAEVLSTLARPRSPFAAPLPADVARHAGWLEPRLVGRVEFADWTSDGRLRLASWRGVVPSEQVDARQFAQPPPAQPSTGQAPAAQAPSAQSATGEPPAAQPSTGAPPTGEPPGAQPSAGEPPAVRPRTDEPPPAQPLAAGPRTGEPPAARARTGKPPTPIGEPAEAQISAGEPAAAQPRTGAPDPAAPPGHAPGPGPRPPLAPESASALTGPPPQRTEARRLEQHFVYNSLNTIASLVRTDPSRARDLLLGFADLTRAADQAASSSEATSTLGHELDAVRAYLRLEQARFGKRLRVQIDVDPALNPLPVQPLVLLAAVRSTVQQHIEPRPEGGTLAVSAQAVAGGCLVHVADEGVGEPTVVAVQGAAVAAGDRQATSAP